LYAYSLKPETDTPDKLAKDLAKEYNIALPEGSRTWNMVEQRLFQALERFKAKKYSESIGLCEEVLMLEPDNVMAYKRLGSTFYKIGDIKRARENWKKVLELAPKDAEADEIRKLIERYR
jgi:tetratricopeptide (TPR) repeat protein